MVTGGSRMSWVRLGEFQRGKRGDPWYDSMEARASIVKPLARFADGLVRRRCFSGAEGAEVLHGLRVVRAEEPCGDLMSSYD